MFATSCATSACCDDDVERRPKSNRATCYVDGGCASGCFGCSTTSDDGVADGQANVADDDPMRKTIDGDGGGRHLEQVPAACYQKLS